MRQTCRHALRRRGGDKGCATRGPMQQRIRGPRQCLSARAGGPGDGRLTRVGAQLFRDTPELGVACVGARADRRAWLHIRAEAYYLPPKGSNYYTPEGGRHGELNAHSHSWALGEGMQEERKKEMRILNVFSSALTVLSPSQGAPLSSRSAPLTLRIKPAIVAKLDASCPVVMISLPAPQHLACLTPLATSPPIQPLPDHPLWWRGRRRGHQLSRMPPTHAPPLIPHDQALTSTRHTSSAHGQLTAAHPSAPS